MSQAPTGSAARRDARRLAKNYLFLSSGEFAAKLLAFGAFTFLGRVLGPERYGSLEFTLAVMVFFTLPVDFGLGDYGAREVAKNPRRAAGLLDEVFELRSLLALAAFAALLLFALLIRKSSGVKLLIALYGVDLFAAPLLLQWFFQGHDRMQWVALVSVMRLGVFAALVFLFIRPASPIYHVGYIECCSAAAAAAACVYILRNRLRYPLPRMHARIRALAAHFREAAPIGLSELSWAFVWYFATVLLGFLAPGRSLGWFGAAHRSVMALHTFVWLYFFNLLPSLSRCASLPATYLLNLLRHSLAFAAWAGILLALMMTLLSGQLLRLAYGSQFAGGARPFGMLVWMIPVALLSGHYRYTLVAYGLQKWLLLSTAISAGVAVVLCFVLISWYGAPGAAAALLSALLVNFALAFIFVQKHVASVGFAAQLVKPLVATAASLALLAAWRPPSEWAAAASAGGVYLLLLALWERRDLRRLFLILAGKDPGFGAEEPQVQG